MLCKFSLNPSGFLLQESPTILGKVNNNHVKISKVQGEVTQHSHAEYDKAIIVLKGCLQLFIEQQEIILKENDLLIIPRETLHSARANEETWVMVIG
ncbi:cupin domain-containing protein [Candidatus Odyssella thessalonicensis]|uniref:cupin domain-containing protein n=1 Tax=Candidatus Odyssella thessalonicensis TaxID=84647 RepID=UPI000225AF5C|nr:cupin domain-containing protein [Candidatus Odyssella thessalonicensis]